VSKHCESNGESYWQHMRFALGLAWDLWKMSVSMVVHAIVPDWERFDDRIMPFLNETKKTLMVRQMAALHSRLMEKALEKVEQAKDDEPSNGSSNGDGSNGHF